MRANPKNKPPVIAAEDLRIELPITAARLQVIALIVQRDVTYLLLPLILEKLMDAASNGMLEVRMRMDLLMQKLKTDDGDWSNICPVEVGRVIVRELGKLGFASQLGKVEDSNSWERLCLEVSWREVQS